MNGERLSLGAANDNSGDYDTGLTDDSAKSYIIMPSPAPATILKVVVNEQGGCAAW